LPDLPTVGEFVPGYEAGAWFGVGVPRNTPAGRTTPPKSANRPFSLRSASACAD
jgi:hypothetical protein